MQWLFKYAFKKSDAHSLREEVRRRGRRGEDNYNVGCDRKNKVAAGAQAGTQPWAMGNHGRLHGGGETCFGLMGEWEEGRPSGRRKRLVGGLERGAAPGAGVRGCAMCEEGVGEARPKRRAHPGQPDTGRRPSPTGIQLPGTPARVTPGTSSAKQLFPASPAGPAL